MSENEMQLGQVKRLDDGRVQGLLSRTYEHDRAEVWHRMTDPAELPKWLAAGTIELRPGGKVRIDFADSGIVIDSTVLEFEDGRLLSYSWSSGDEPERPLRWALSEVGPGRTRLDLRVTLPSGEDAAKACAGFEGHLEMLAAVLEDVPVKFPLELYLAARKAYAAMLD